MAAQVNDRKKDVKQSWLPKSTTEKKTLNSHGCPSQRQKKYAKQSWLPKSTTEKKTLNSHGCPSQRQKKRR